MTNEQYEQLVNNLKTQDSRATANPIFLVQRYRAFYPSCRRGLYPAEWA